MHSLSSSHAAGRTLTLALSHTEWMDRSLSLSPTQEGKANSLSLFLTNEDKRTRSNPFHTGEDSALTLRVSHTG